MNRFHVFQFYLLFLLIINVGCAFLLDSQTKRNVDRDTLTTACKKMETKILSPGPKHYVSLRCSKCKKKFTKDDVYWLKRRREGDGRNDEVLYIDGKRIFWVPNYSVINLRITDLRLEDAGIYTCVKGNAIQGTYDLIVNHEPNRKGVFISLGEKSAEVEVDENGDLLMYTKWSSWSECNRCREMGERQRPGWCKTESGGQCIYAAKYDEKKSYEERKKYAGGYDKVLYEECYRSTCPLKYKGKEDAELMDGSQLSQMNIHNLETSLPEARKLIIKQVGESVLFVCPDTTDVNILLSWRKGVMAISNTGNKRRGRLNHIMVDWTSNLHIRDLTTEDSGLYSCWENYKLKAVIRLSVVATPIRGLPKDAKKYVLYVSLGLGLAIVVFIIASIIKRIRKNSKKNIYDIK